MRQHEQTITKQLVLTWDIHDLKRYSSVTNNNYIFILVMHTTIQLFFSLHHSYFNPHIFQMLWLLYSLYITLTKAYYTLKVWVVIKVLCICFEDRKRQKRKYDAAVHVLYVKKIKLKVKSWFEILPSSVCKGTACTWQKTANSTGKINLFIFTPASDS